MNSTPEHSSLSRTSSSDSLLSIMENAQENEISVPEYSSDVDGRDSDSYRGSFQFSQISTLLPSGVVSFFMQPSTKGQKLEEEESHAFPEKSLQSSEQELVPLSFFDDDDGVFELASETDLPAPLEGGILLARTYSVSAKVLNGIIFKPGSQFLKNLIDKQKSTDFSEGPWVKGGQGHPKRVITYVKAASKLVKSVKATEDQKYSRADKKGFVLDAVAVTPDAPYGKSFRVEIQYCIFARLDAASGERTCFLRVSWRVCFLTSTMMKRVIENGARQGLQDNFRDFEEILIKFAKPIVSNRTENSVRAEALDFKSDWRFTIEYFLNFHFITVVLITMAILLHIYISNPCPSSGLEVWKIDLPDTLHEFLISAILGVYIEHIFLTARKFIRAKLFKVSDHGVKAKGDGWLLTVTLVCAKNLPGLVEGTGPDPFVVFTCSGKARTSSVKLQTYNPKWGERFEFDATEELPSTMNVEVFNFEGPFTEAESVGHAEINFLKQSPEQLADLWVPLEGKDAVSAGSKIHLRIVLTSTKETDSAGTYIKRVEKEVGRKITKHSFVKNASFQKLFQLPSEEFLVNDFSCSLKRKFLLQGRIFLSPRVLAFYSNIFGHKTRFMLLWDDMDEIKEASPALSSMGISLNPTILVFMKKGRGMDANHGAKNIDERGRLKFQFQSFIHYKPAYRTMMVLWNERNLSPEQKMDKIAELEQGDAHVGDSERQTDDSEIFLGFDEAKQTEVHSVALPVSVRSLLSIFENEKLEEKIAKKMGRLNYVPTAWESMGDDNVQQRRVSYKLSNQISLFGTTVTSIQQKTKLADGHTLYLDEVLTLHDVPFGDNFQIQVRKEMVDVSHSPPSTSCKVFVGVAWQKSTLFQEQISRNIFQRYTKHLKEFLDIGVGELLYQKD
ncbi:hypothetical protein KP509_22G016900 [Ceratopteris richardii]|nr:hypothetical protein KP509_22G016900 [Ceratopteris richardii]